MTTEPTSHAHPRRRRGGVIVVAVAVVVVGVGGYVAWVNDIGPLASSERCEINVGDTEVTVDLEQAQYASLMAARATQRGLPARATSIAIATASQESKIRNVEHGDRDSVGLFQQRPSQGWGTVKQIMNPVYSIDKFYDALVEVDGYEEMDLHDAAQEVQRSADGSAYEQHEENARAMASALTGYSPAALTCDISDLGDSDQSIRRNGLTPDANAVRRDVATAFGDLPIGGFEPGGVSSGHSEDSAHYDGRAIDYFFRPIDRTKKRGGWALAHYLVANAERLKVATVIFDAKIWTASRSSEGWREYEAPDGPNQDVLLHRDHVHVDVA